VRRPVDGSRATTAPAPTPHGLIRILFQLHAALQPRIRACFLALFTHAFSAISVVEDCRGVLQLMSDGTVRRSVEPVALFPKATWTTMTAAWSGRT
jgi:hypothetical protein